MKREALRAVKTVARAVALATAAALLGGTPVHAVNPIMHNNSTTTAFGSPSKYGSWGNVAPTSKYGQFTCTTCHTAGLAGGNAKQIKPAIVLAGGPSPSGTVIFGSYTSYGSDTAHATSTGVCEVCHSQTSHHRYNNPGSNHKLNVDCTSCHLHSNGFSAGGESPGGVACDGCHNDLYLNGSGYGMHSQSLGMSYKHYMDNALTTSDGTLSGGWQGASWYATNIPNSSGGTAVYPAARRCLMCHVDHDQFKSNRASNLRPNVTNVPPAGGVNRDDNLCLSCHTEEKTKAYPGPNGEAKVVSIPYPSLSYGNATTILNRSTHGYPTLTTYADGSTFNAVCVKCHNDSIGKNGETPKSSVNGQKGTSKFGEHNSTVPGRFSIFSNDFYQRPASGTTLTWNSTNKTVTVGVGVALTSPGWTTDLFLGHYLVITNGGGANQRALVIGNSDNTLTLSSWPTGLDNTSSFDVTDDNLSIDNVCFNCHSHNGQGKANGNLVDWYGQQPITDNLEKIYDLFVGDSGTLTASVNRKTSVTVTLTKNSWTSANIAGYVLKAPGGSRVITAITAGPGATAPYSYTLTIAPYLTSGAGGVQIIKPSSHPLDTFARHESDERVITTIGWNKGDQGSTTAASSATAATSITDTTKLWSGTEFTGGGLTITFPNLFEGSGRVIRPITGGAVNTVTWTTPVSGLNTLGGDNYYIGSRHVSCGDCHNTHASFKNPEGTVTAGGTNSTTISDNTLIDVPGWYDNIWTGYLLKVRSTSGATKDTEQIRYITGFSKGTGQYTVSLPFTGTIDNTYSYEVMMGEKWSAAGQSGGRAGSGSSGVWGTLITGGWTTGFTRANGALVSGINLAITKIENVFDNTGTIGGNAAAGQRDLCVRCHSYYSFGTATPMTPSGNADGSPVRSTDTAAEFNPNNVAHHAVYARGNNQPIQPTGTLPGATSYYNSNWPVYSTGTITINTNGTASISGGAFRSTVLPGWYVYRGTLTAGKPPATATSGWYQITTITSSTANSTSFTVTPTPATPQSGSYAVTAGLGNSFVPPYGPWSILRCSDCHGSTKTDPVGPHASVNKWLLKDADTALKFEWDNGTAIAVVDYALSLDSGGNVLSTADKAYFCFNCHRADVYGSVAGAAAGATPNRTLLSRASHGQMWVADGTNIAKPANLPKWPQYCRHCHGGDKIGGIHGSNAARVKGDAVPQSVRFLNGATWNNGVGLTTGACYTQATATAVSSCTQHKTAGGTNNTFTIQYPYTSY